MARRTPGRRRSALLAGVVAASVLPTGLAQAYSERPSASDRRAAVTPLHTADETDALREAANTGEPVEVLSQRTETSQVFANPEGDFTEDVYATAQWVRRDGRLLDIDTTLSPNPDGSLSPAATEVAVTFSGGGDTALATVTRDGRSLGLRWPEALPEPTVEGDTVTYPAVLDGVDLKLQARSGGFGQVLVVHDAEAAANPALAELAYGIETAGLEVSADEHGNVSAINPAEQEVFNAATPLMWDSGVIENLEDATSSREAAQAEPSVSTEFSPGIGARHATVETAIVDDTLVLTPDQEVLSGSETTYPVYIDPSVDGSRHSWTIAYKKYPNSSFYNGSGFNGGTNEARVGYENQTDGTARSFFRMNTKNLKDTNRVISSSRFRIRNTWSWSCTKREVQLWYTGAFTNRSTWNNQPAWRSRLDTVNDARGWGSGCPAGNLVFDTTQGARTAQSNGFNTLTLGMRATNEGDVYGWKKFSASSAVLSTTYNTRPANPTGMDTYPVSTVDSDCGSSAPYQYIGNTDFYLQAKVKDGDGGTVRATFHLWPTGRHGDGVIVNKTVSVSSGGIARVKITRAELAPHLATTGGDFTWKVRASDGSLNSAWVPSYGCRFLHDPQRPSTPPDVTSAQFPDGENGWPPDTSAVRQEGTFTLAPNGVTDVTTYRYWTSWDTTVKTATVPAGGSASIKLTPTTAGPNLLYVQSGDPAGNRSDTRNYLFYASGLATPDAPGDINGDGYSDIWGIDGSGTLTRHYGLGDGSVHSAAEPADEGDWGDAQITHQGDWNGDGYEDLLALRDVDGTHQLWLHPNTGTGAVCDSCLEQEPVELAVYDEENDHWSDGVKQIVALGDVDGGLDVDGDGTEEIPGYPDLLVNDGQFLWLYYGSPDLRLDAHRDPVLLAGPDDPISDNGATIAEITISAPGDWNDDGALDLIVSHDRPEHGDLYVYNGALAEGGYTISLEERAYIGWGWSSDNVLTHAAIPTSTGSHVLEFWGAMNSGHLVHGTVVDEGGLIGDARVLNQDFVGYRYIS
ncbi:VCBS repeat-containing protein [Streptomyces sedi]|uniref:VCBS repeat-containing protein n=1 Tax=Streptomyces sedi TaxID=555059 RepID=A0A5C4VF45_9ACTN|nr:VCBS repeat-containing protein [Streptomyces sedi]